MTVEPKQERDLFVGATPEDRAQIRQGNITEKWKGPARFELKERRVTGVPVLAIAITILAITGVTLINNSRKGDVKEVLRAELKSHRAETETGFVQLEARMAPRFNSMDRRLDEPLRIVGEHETGIARIEERPR